MGPAPASESQKPSDPAVSLLLHSLERVLIGRPVPSGPATPFRAPNTSTDLASSLSYFGREPPLADGGIAMRTKRPRRAAAQPDSFYTPPSPQQRAYFGRSRERFVGPSAGRLADNVGLRRRLFARRRGAATRQLQAVGAARDAHAGPSERQSDRRSGRKARFVSGSLTIEHPATNSGRIRQWRRSSRALPG